MKKLCVVVLAVVLLASAAPLWAQGSGKTEGGTVKAEKQPPPPTREVLVRLVTAMRGFVGEEGIKHLKGRAGRYPFMGVGIAFDIDHKNVDAATGRENFAVVISSVYRGSPAERAGIRPGDWLTRVSGKPTCQIAVTPEDTQTEERLKEEKKDYQSCMAATLESIRGSGDRVVLEVERSGTLAVYDLEKAQIGQGVADFFTKHQAEWETILRANEKDLSAVAAKMDASPDTPESLLALGEELYKIWQGVSGPFVALEEQIVSGLTEDQKQKKER